MDQRSFGRVAFDLLPGLIVAGSLPHLRGGGQ